VILEVSQSVSEWAPAGDGMQDGNPQKLLEESEMLNPERNVGNINAEIKFIFKYDAVCFSIEVHNSRAKRKNIPQH
jgi:hypothetical protein